MTGSLFVPARSNIRMLPQNFWRHVRQTGVLSSIRLRLIFWYVLILALVLTLFSGAIYATEQQALLAQLDHRLDTRLGQLAATYNASTQRLMAPFDSATQMGDEIVFLLTSTGQVIQIQASGQLSAVKASWNDTQSTLRHIAESDSGTRIEQGFMLTAAAGTSKDGHTPLTLRTTAIFRLGGMALTLPHQTRMLLVVGMRSDVAQQLASLAQTLETVAPLILVICAAGGYWLADRSLRPLQAITRAARHIEATDLSRRLHMSGRDELSQLAAVFDQMLDRLEGAFVQQRQFTADASHELRTPLTVIDLETAHALAYKQTPEQYRHALAVVQQETHYMTGLVNDLLMLARADSGAALLNHTEVDLGDLIFDVAERLSTLARESEMALFIHPVPELLVRGDQAALTRLLTNIIENALKYGAGRGKKVEISSGYRSHNNRMGVFVQIADDGPGIAAEHLPHLGERFYRVDPARTHNYQAVAQGESPKERKATGSGLGLAISRWIVAQHQGNLHIHSELGTGTTVDIWLPQVVHSAARESRISASHPADHREQ